MMGDEIQPNDERELHGWHEPLLPHYVPKFDEDGNLIIDPNLEYTIFDDGTGKVYSPRPFLKTAFANMMAELKGKKPDA